MACQLITLLIIFSITRVKFHCHLNNENVEDQLRKEQQNSHDNNNDKQYAESNPNSTLPLCNDETNDDDEDSRILNKSRSVSSAINNIDISSIIIGNYESPLVLFDELIKDIHSSKSSGSDNASGRHSIVCFN